MSKSSHPLNRHALKTDREKYAKLIRLAVHVYNDSKTTTLSARSWPTRVLAGFHADHVVNMVQEKGLDAPFEPMELTSAMLRYLDPVIYAEMPRSLAISRSRCSRRR